jgi:sugar/nucleoside kinase (ribokinase family)
VGADRRAAIRALPGGSGANQAAWLATEGVATTFAGRVGAADRSHQAGLLEAFGVDVFLTADEDVPTGVLITLIAPDGERSFLTDRAANLNLRAKDLPDRLLDGTDLLHVSGYSLFETGPRAAVLGLIGRAKGRSIPFSVDPSSYSFLVEVGGEAFFRSTAGAAILFPNEDEAAVLAGSDDPDAQLRALTRRYPLVVLKRGAKGAVAADSSGARCSVPALAVEVLDTSGAGDAFFGGFLGAWLRGASLEASLKRAVELGSFAVTILGARPPVTPPA